MTFTELQKIFEEKFSIIRLADIARELGVTPQVVSNWKSRDQVPYKYIKIFREKINNIEKSSNSNTNDHQKVILGTLPNIDDDEMSISEFIISSYIVLRKMMVRNNIAIVIVTTFLFISVAFIYLRYFSTPVYLSTSKILPISDDGGVSGIDAIVSQFGLNKNKNNIRLTSASMYPEIIKSQYLAKSLLRLKFDTIKHGKNQSLISILLGKKNNTDKWSDIDKIVAATKLGKLISVTKSKKSALFTLTATANEPMFARDLLSAVITELEKILIGFKLNRTEEKKQFIEIRISDVGKELIKAEEKLKVFRESNKYYSDSPALLLVEERLIREVEVQTQVYITLKNQYEMVQIEKVEKGRMFQVLDKPVMPIGKISPRPKQYYILALIAGIVFGIIIIVTKIWYEENKDNFKDLAFYNG